VLNELQRVRDRVVEDERQDNGGERTETDQEENGFGPFAGEEFAGE
jgi:hypothetical protein